MIVETDVQIESMSFPKQIRNVHKMSKITKGATVAETLRIERGQSDEIIVGLRAMHYKLGIIHPIHRQGRRNPPLRGHHRELQQTPQQGQLRDEDQYGNVESKV
jgi:hypothetical protein